MALSRETKAAVIEDLAKLLETSKLTVVAKYAKTSVSEMQQLRAEAAESGTTVKVAKNRLVKVALSKVDKLKDIDSKILEGQLLYAFNSEDEVAPAQSLYNFAKEHPQIEFVGAFTSDGAIMEAEQVTVFAQLPSKDQLRAQLVGTIAAPLSSFVSVLGGNMRGLVNVLNARSQEI